jgi:hypothetical protein
MVFLSIITRCYKRPKMLAQLRRSLDAQTCQDFEHIQIIDDVGIGVEEANRRLTDVEIRGQFAYVLDDDNELADDEFVASLKEIVKHYRPDVIMVRSENGGLGILPMPGVWGKAPIQGQVDMLNFVVSADVYRAHAAAFDNGYCGDYHFINDVFQRGAYRVYWHDTVVARIQRRSWGAPE